MLHRTRSNKAGAQEGSRTGTNSNDQAESGVGTYPINASDNSAVDLKPL